MWNLFVLQSCGFAIATADLWAGALSLWKWILFMANCGRLFVTF